MNKTTRFSSIDPIGWSLYNPFPGTVTVGEDYEGVYQLVSNLPAPMPAPLTVTHTGGSDFTVQDQCSGLFLVPGQTCNITVRFTPSSAGVQQFQLVLHYFNDVVPLPVQTMTAEGSSTRLIVGSVTQALPANTGVGSTYPVIFTFQNVGGTNATNLLLDRNYPGDFTEESNTCSTTLAVGASCAVQGSLVPSSPGSYEVAAALYYAESETPASVSTNTEAITIDVTGAVTTPLPSLTAVGDSFLVVFTYTNNSALPATSVDITTNYPAGFTQQSNNCTGILGAHASCTIQGTFTPATAGDFTVAVSLAYAESSEPVPLSTSTTAALGVVGDVTLPLPATTSVDVGYSVVFTYTNEGSVTATDLIITPNYPPEFTQQSNTCSGSLAVDASCTVEGTLLASSVGNYSVGVSLAYAQSLNPVPLSTNTSAIVVNITGAVSTALPDTTALNTNYPVVFSYTNNSSIVATNLVLTPSYPTGFVPGANTCLSGTLAPTQTCTIEGIFTPVNSGPYTVATSLTYAGAPAAIPLSTSTSTLGSLLTGVVSTPLPEVLEVGTDYPVVFTYTNASPLPATNLVFTPNYPDGFMETSTTCEMTLAGNNSSCSVSGTLTPPSSTPPGPVTVGLDLSYLEGPSIELETESEIGSAIIAGTVNNLPNPVTASTTPLVVTFSFFNSGNTPASIEIEKNYPDEFEETSDFCSLTGILNVNESCTVEGNLSIDTLGDYLVEVTLNADGDISVPLQAGTSVITAEVTGAVDVNLPGNTSVGGTYAAQFSFTNNSEVDVGITLTENFPANFTITNNECGDTLLATDTCIVNAEFEPSIAEIGPQTATITLNYSEGSVPLSTSTTVSSVVLQGRVTQPAPELGSINMTYPVIFTYTNPSVTSATNLSLVSTNGLTDIINDCNLASLASGGMCTISGNLSTPSTLGTYVASVTLDYTEGEPIPLSTSTLVGNRLAMIVGNNVLLTTTTVTGQWSRSSFTLSPTFYGITFSPLLRLYVAVGIEGSTPVIYWTTDRSSWTRRPNGVNFIPLNIIWNPDLSQLLVVGQNGGIAISFDGINWILQNSPTSITLRSATWSPQQFQYVVVGGSTGSGPVILTSPDGINWQIQDSGISDLSTVFTGVAWGSAAGIYVVTTNVNAANLTTFLSSPDAITWMSHPVSAPTTRSYGLAVAWSPTYNRFVVMGLDSYVRYSSDGIVWSAGSNSALVDARYVLWDPTIQFFTSAGDAVLSSYTLRNPTGMGDWNLVSVSGSAVILNSGTVGVTV